MAKCFSPWRGRLYVAIHGTDRLTRTSCSRPLRLNHFPRKSHSLRRIYARGSSPFLLGYEKHPNYLGRAFENTCAEIKNKNLVCAKNQEIHANNSKTRIRYVQKSRKHMQTAPPNCGLLFFEKLHGSIEDKFPCRYFLGRVKTKTRHYGSIAKNLLSRYSISSKWVSQSQFFPYRPIFSFLCVICSEFCISQLSFSV